MSPEKNRISASLPADLLNWLRARARANCRTISGECAYLLDKARRLDETLDRVNEQKN